MGLLGLDLAEEVPEESFIEQLFEGTRSKELLVWSPYLPKDLPSFVQRFKKTVAIKDLEISFPRPELAPVSTTTLFIYSLLTQYFVQPNSSM